MRAERFPFLNLTVPIDASPVARRGIEYALTLARGGAAVHFCCVVDIGLSGAIGSQFDPVPVIEALEEDARRACREAMALAETSGVTADSKIVFGSVAVAVGRYATEVGSDAIVIGTNARRGVAPIAFGSVAESLIATCSIPVIVVHSDDVVETLIMNR
jgi:nucleotide-binding universal stress UspA family protein